MTTLICVLILFYIWRIYHRWTKFRNSIIEALFKSSLEIAILIVWVAFLNWYLPFFFEKEIFHVRYL